MMRLGEKLVRLGREYTCEICNIPPLWNGIKLNLQVDHKDGDHKNNDEDNLRFVCPNCHSQTSTYCGKNKKRHPAWKQISEEKFISTIQVSYTASEVMRLLGLNHRNALIRNHIIHLCESHGIKFKCKNETSIIQSIVEELLESKIEFSKFGWVKPASIIIGIEPQKVSKWMMRNMPSFYNDKCFKRNMRVWRNW